MTPEQDQALCTDFPGIFQQRHESMTVTCMCWGFECNSGWEPLIRSLCKQLQFIEKVSGIQTIASQVKEKYGSLRFHYYTDFSKLKDDENNDNWQDIIDSIVNDVENQSFYTCEICGKWGTINTEGYWLSCRCASCREKEKAERKST